MSDITEMYVDKFWELIDVLLNTVLFVMIGMEGTPKRAYSISSGPYDEWIEFYSVKLIKSWKDIFAKIQCAKSQLLCNALIALNFSLNQAISARKNASRKCGQCTN